MNKSSNIEYESKIYNISSYEQLMSLETRFFKLLKRRLIKINKMIKINYKFYYKKRKIVKMTVKQLYYPRLLM
jgi:hypothetical protein